MRMEKPSHRPVDTAETTRLPTSLALGPHSTEVWPRIRMRGITMAKKVKVTSGGRVKREGPRLPLSEDRSVAYHEEPKRIKTLWTGQTFQGFQT